MSQIVTHLKVGSQQEVITYNKCQSRKSGGVKQNGNVSNKLSDDYSVTTRKSAPPLPKLPPMVALPLKLNQGVIRMSTKNIQKQVLLNLTIL